MARRSALFTIPSETIEPVARRRGHPGKLCNECGFRVKRAAMADIVLVNPTFDASYWGLDHALPLFGKRANVPPASLPLLAALTPAGHQVTLIDESVEPLDF